MSGERYFLITWYCTSSSSDNGRPIPSFRIWKNIAKNVGHQGGCLWKYPVAVNGLRSNGKEKRANFCNFRLPPSTLHIHSSDRERMWPEAHCHVRDFRAILTMTLQNSLTYFPVNWYTIMIESSSRNVKPLTQEDLVYWEALGVENSHLHKLGCLGRDWSVVIILPWAARPWISTIMHGDRRFLFPTPNG